MNIYMHLMRFFVNAINLCCGNDLTKREKRDIIKPMFAMANKKRKKEFAKANRI